MRASGGCTMQQSLTAEAAGVVKQAINLARRRGHAQVTPIHVASVLLASPAGLLQRACLKSHSHPLQQKALELCFNVALNRLPTTSPSPILSPPHPHHQNLSLSNALVAAFKRAQAHQRRGSIENQQQPILALKIEIEQLVISILDDPSVSRVMREAGFSSAHVKTNVEQAVSLEASSSKNTTSPLSRQYSSKESNTNPLVIRAAGVLQPSPSPQPLPLGQFEVAFSKPSINSTSQVVRSEDVSSVIESLVNKSKKNNTVVVGECVGDCEGVVKAVKDRIERGDVPIELRYAQFLSLPLMLIKSFSREEIDMKLGELKCLLKGCLGRGIVLYLGDLMWVSEYWAYYGKQQRSFYCPVEHMIMGLRRLVLGNNMENGRLRLLGIANFNSYIKCKTGHPSLETLLDLRPLTIPVGSLDFSLNLESSFQGDRKSILSDENSWPKLEYSSEMSLTCCSSCSAKFHQEAQSLAASVQNFECLTTTTTTTTTTTSTTSSLPSWLQKCKEESEEESDTSNKKDHAQIKELCKKWNSICSSIHRTLNFSSGSPSSFTSNSSYDQKNPKVLHENKLGWRLLFEPEWSSKDHQLLMADQNYDPPKPDLLSNPNSTPNSASSSEATETIMDKPLGFKEYNPENLQAMCSALKKKVPWQKEIIQDIAITVLKCRCGLVSRKGKSNSNKEQEKQETWLFFLGVDDEGKVKIGRELAKLIFGSQNCFKSIGLSSFSPSTKADCTDDSRNKRARDESGHGFLERFAGAIRDDPHRVFYVEDVEQVDHFSQKGIKKAIESGRITLHDGEIVPLEDAIIIFSTESFSSTSRACSPPIKQKIQHDHDNGNDQGAEKKNDKEDYDDVDDEEEASSACVPLDLNVAADEDSGHSVGDIGILDSVDRQVFFKIHLL